MLVYEVNLQVSGEVAERFSLWLHKHVQDMLALPGFLRADVFAVDGEQDGPERHWTVHYLLMSQQHLDRYLDEHAPRMRDEAVQRFSDRFSASRRVLRLQSAPPAAARPGPPAIKDLDHLVIRVENLAPMIAFYRDTLGCRVEKVQENLGLYQLRAGSSLIDLVTVDGPIGREGGAAPGMGGRNMDHFCLRIDPFDQDVLEKWLQAQGVDAGKPVIRYGADGNGPSVYLSDPEGNTVELKGPPEESA